MRQRKTKCLTQSRPAPAEWTGARSASRVHNPGDMQRRTFVQAAVAGAAGALAPKLLGQAVKAAPKKMVGIQIAMASFAKPDYEKVLDLLQDKACVNTLFVKTLDYPGRADQSRYRGGNSTMMHAQYYLDYAHDWRC